MSDSEAKAKPAVSRRRLLARIRHWRPKLHLTDWQLAVEYRELAEDEGSAHCMANPEYREATLRFDPRYLTADNLDATVVHELLHCHVWSLANVAETLAGKNKGHREWSRTEEEFLVTRLERLIRGLAPE